MSLHVYISLINYRALGGRVGPVGFRSEDRSQRRQMFEPSNRGTLFWAQGKAAIHSDVRVLCRRETGGLLGPRLWPRIHQLIVAAALGYHFCK